MINIERLQRIPNRIKREILRIPVFQALSKLAYEEEIEKHFNYLPTISPIDYTLVNSLRHSGAYVTCLQALAIPSTSLLIAGAEKLLPELRAFSSQRKSAISIPLRELMNYPELFLWGLEERLLNLVENYIGLPVLYLGADLRREIANGKIIGTRQWHLDVEDYCMLKIIIYLTDVDLDSGPFEYISKPLTNRARQALKYGSGFVSDPVMKTVVSEDDCQPCTGRYGTVILTDTCNVFHRVKAPIVSDRISITFSYTSRRPIKTYKLALSLEELLSILSRLSNYQRDCILR
jgi:hypothetical protein